MSSQPSPNVRAESVKLDETTIRSTSSRLVRQTLHKLGPASINGAAMIGLLQAEARDTDAIVDSLLLCPTLTARVLSVVNSAAFALPKQINSVERAVVLLGPARARTLSMAYGLRIMTERCGLPRETIETLWISSLHKACAARRLCAQHAPELADQAYANALIQDIGLPMLMAVDPEYYVGHIAAVTHRVKWHSHESERFGFDHCAVGHGLLREWGAGEPLQQAVLDHHCSPMDLDANSRSIVKLAGFFASLMPHMDEQVSPYNINWIQAIHARFLSGCAPSPDRFFRDVADDVAKIQMQANNQAGLDDTALMRAITRQVASSAVSVTAKLCYMEQRVRQHREGIQTLRFQAFTDGLTHVLNRRGFAQLGQRRLAGALERNVGICCMLCDLDNFKGMNDTYGHEVGDMVLRGLAKLLRRRLSESDLIGRLGGDEFAVFITDITRDDARKLAQRLVDSIGFKMVKVRNDLSVKLQFSLGVLYCRNNLAQYNVDDLLKLADQAMYEQKRGGKNGMTFISPHDDDEAESPDSDAHPHARQHPR